MGDGRDVYESCDNTQKQGNTMTESVKYIWGRLRYLTQDGGLFNGFKEYKEEIISGDWDEKILKVDKYLHDLLQETITKREDNPHGCEKSSVREERWT